jgi:hypothetical protein
VKEIKLREGAAMMNGERDKVSENFLFDLGSRSGISRERASSGYFILPGRGLVKSDRLRDGLELGI